MNEELTSFEDILSRAKDKAAQRKPIAAVVDPVHPEIFEAVTRAAEAGLIAPAFVGRRAEVEPAADEQEFDLSNVLFHETPADQSSVVNATRLAAEGEVDLIVNGSCAVDDFITDLFAPEADFAAKGKMVSHVTALEPERYRKLLFLSDAFVTIAPDLKAKIGLVNNLIAVAMAVGVEMPKVAVLAAVEVVYLQMPVTTEAAVLAKMGDRHQFKGGAVDGPLSFDCAVDPAAAEAKGIGNSPVAGNADCLLAPNIETAHGIYKAMALYGNATVGGIIVGGTVPVALVARCAPADTIFHSIALGVVVA